MVTLTNNQLVILNNLAANNSFFASLADQAKIKGFLSPKQIGCIERIVPDFGEMAVQEEIQHATENISLPTEIAPELQGLSLLEFQKLPVTHLFQTLQRSPAALMAWEMGTGKTYGASALAKALNMNVYVICPGPVRPNWKPAFDLMGVAEERILDVQNYEICAAGKTHGFRAKKRGEGSVAITLENPYIHYDNETKTFTITFPENTLVILDEAHRCKNDGTRTSNMLIAIGEYAKTHNVKVLMLSGTITENPQKFYAVGLTLGLFNTRPEFGKFQLQYGCVLNEKHLGRRVVKFYDFVNPQKVKLLNKRIFPAVGSRICRAEIPDFPKCTISIEALEIDETPLTSQHKAFMKRMLYAVTEIEEQIERLKFQIKEIRCEIDTYPGTVYPSTFEEARVRIAMIQEQLMPLYPLLIIRKRQYAEARKLTSMVDIVEDLVSEGRSVVVMLNFTETIEMMVEILNRNGRVAGRFDGPTENVREADLIEFQANTLPIMICNVAAAKEGINMHDLHNARPRVAIFTPTYNPQNLWQAFGRIWRAGGSNAHQFVYYEPGSIEEEVWLKLKKKVEALNFLNDGQITASELTADKDEFNLKD